MRYAADPEITSIFLAEARDAITVLEDEALSGSARVERARDLKCAAGTLGFDELESTAEEAERFLGAGLRASARRAIAHCGLIVSRFMPPG